MKKHTSRLLALMLLFALLFGMIPVSGTFRAFAEEPEIEATTETTITTEETCSESETEAQPSDESESVTEPEETEETEPPEETLPPDDDETPEETKPDVEESDEEDKPSDPSEPIRASSYNLQIPMILYGTSTLNVSFKFPGDPNQTTYTANLSGLRIHYLNGKIAYCLEPQAGSTAGAVYSQIAAGANLNVWERFLSTSQRNAIALVLAYGAPNGMTSTNSLTRHGYEAAAQVIIWEMIIGYRNTVTPFTRTNNSLYNFVLSLCNPNDSTGTLRAAYINAYNTIISKMQNHGKIPSFASKKQAQAPEYQMSFNPQTGLYSLVLTDTNNAINNDFPYVSGNGLTFTKSGNQLTVTATAEAMQNQPVMVSSTGSNPDSDNIAPVIWGTTNSNHSTGQILSQMATPDPVVVYFKLKAMTTLSIQKVCSDGNISGITFTVKDSGGNTLFTGQTDQNGFLDVPNLEIGATVTVTETVPDNYVTENRTQTVTLEAGTNTVTFRNVPLGTGTMIKTSDAGDVEGYCFNLYRARTETNGSKTWYGKSDPDGRIYETDSSYNAVGSEKSYEFRGLIDGKYAFREVLSLYGAGNVWPESITFSTSGGTTAACSLVFTGEQLIAQENGDCTVSGINLTGLDGGGTLTITIKNEPVIIPEGSIMVRKENEKGQVLSGVTFLLEYSLDSGTSWDPVFNRNEADPVIPGGCTSPGLTEGKLSTDADGNAVFAGLSVEDGDEKVLYRLTEIETAAGYGLLAAPAFEGTLPEEEEYIVAITVVNMPEFRMPMTGGWGFCTAMFGFAIAAAAALILLAATRKKKTDTMQEENCYAG